MNRSNTDALRLHSRVDVFGYENPPFDTVILSEVMRQQQKTMVKIGHHSETDSIS